MTQLFSFPLKTIKKGKTFFSSIFWGGKNLVNDGGLSKVWQIYLLCFLFKKSLTMGLVMLYPYFYIYIYIVEPTRNDDIKSKILPCQKNTESVSILCTSELLQNGLPIHPHTYTYNFKRLRHKRRASYFSIFCVNNTANITNTQKDMDTTMQ